MKSFNRLILGTAALSALAVAANASPFQNGSFEINNVDYGDYKYAPDVPDYGHDNVTADGWDFSNGTGISRNAGAWTNHVAPDGDSYAFVQGGALSVLSQTFDVTNGQTYRVSFKSLTRVYENGTGTFKYGIGNTFFGNSPVNTDAWQTTTFTFTASGSSATLKFTGDSPAVDNTAFVDHVQVEAVPEPFTMSLGFAAVGVMVRRKLKKSQ